MEANEGGGAGGHAGLRLGDEVYHFEFGDGGLLVLARDPWPDVLRQYTEIENRPIHVARLEVSRETATLLRRFFNRRVLTQRRHLERLERLREERALFERWARAEPDAEGASVAVAGYFFDALPQAEPRGGTSAFVAGVRDRILTSRGPASIRERRARLQTELEGLVPEAGPADAPRADALPVPQRSFLDRYEEILEQIVALDVLEGAPSVLMEALVDPGPVSGSLDESERARLEALRGALAGEALALFDSPRPDRGRALLVSLARLGALEHSLRRGRWLLLDVAAGRGAPLAAGALARRPDLAPRAREAASVLWSAARQAFSAAAPAGEREWSRLEQAAARLAQWQHARRGAPPRVGLPRSAPDRPARWPDAPRPRLENWEARAHAARQRERAFAAELDSLYGYDLVRRNCASEIFQSIHDAFAELDPADGVEAESRRRLGGYVPARRSLAFIPFVSQWEARRRYRIAGTRTHPAWRARTVRAMAERGSGLRVALRESVAFTARSYEPHPRDSFFVFFTEDAAPIRPLLGAVNVLAGVAESGVGLLTWPFDGGRRLVRGLKGMAVSLPELAFVNIRKGTNEIVPPLGDPLGGAREEPASVAAVRGGRAATQGREKMSLQPPNGLSPLVVDSR